jgi:hypothetical protein
MERKTYTAPDSFAIGLATENMLALSIGDNSTHAGTENEVYSSREAQPTGGGAGLWENMGK